MKKNILLVEDEKTTALLIQKYIRDLGYNTLDSVSRGDEVIDAVTSGRPDLILMDITLEGDIDGIEAARLIHENFHIPIIYISSSSDDSTLKRAVATNPSGYIIKPIDKKELAGALSMAFLRHDYEEKLQESESKFSTILNSIGDAVIVTDSENRISYLNPLAEKMCQCSSEQALGRKMEEVARIQAKEVQENDGDDIIKQLSYVFLVTKNGEKIPVDYKASPLGNMNGENESTVLIVRDDTARVNAEQKLTDSYNQLKKAMSGIIDAMTQTVETRDPYTAGHQRRVAEIARHISLEMKLGDEQSEGLYFAALIHDLGKISVPAEILSKPGRINETEFNLIKMHPQIGFDILKTIDFPWPVAEIVHQHHERIDGSGYPQGLSGNEILFEARIICVADVVEAMGSHRPYRAALGTEKALDEISKNRGIIYDKDAVDACLSVFSKRLYSL